MNIPRIPFTVLALAPYLGSQFDPWQDPPLRIDKTNFDEVMDRLAPSSHVSVPRELYPDENLELRFTSLKEFHPDSLIQTNPVLSSFRQAAEYVAKALKTAVPVDEINRRLAQWQHLPSIRVERKPPERRPKPASAIDSILDMVAMPDETPGRAPSQDSPGGGPAEVLRRILVYLYGDPNVTILEAAWRGLRLLVEQFGPDDDVQVRIVPVTQGTLEDTLADLTAYLLDDLPSLVLVDLPFDSGPKSLELLKKLAGFSETLLVPAAAWAAPAFFNCDTWYDVQKLMYLPHYLEDAAFAKYRSLRKTALAAWIALCCVRFLSRYPYGPDNKPRVIYFEEKTRPWINPVWALGALMVQSFSRMGWPTRFTEWQQMRLEDLALNMDDPGRPLPIEAHFDRDRLDQLHRCGLVPLATATGKDVAFIPSETTLADVSLSHQLLVSRVTQLIIWCKDHFRKDLAAEDVEAELRRAFEVFWQESGHRAGPETLEISAGKPDPQGRIPLAIRLEPSPSILAPQRSIELQFAW